MQATKSGTKFGSKSEFIRAQDPSLSAADVVKLAKAAGLKLTLQGVYNVRWTSKQKGAGTHAAPKSTAATSAAPKSTAAKPVAASGLAGFDALDLSYAIHRLVASGKTTTAEVTHLASERAARMASLENEIGALKRGAAPAHEATPANGSHKKRAKK